MTNSYPGIQPTDGSPKQPGKTDTFSDTIDETWGRGPIMIDIDDQDSKGNA